MSETALTVTSPSFQPRGYIPRKHSARAEDISPCLELEGICRHAGSIAVTMDDASHPLFHHYNHWVIWNLPLRDVIPKAIPHGKVIDELGGAIQERAYGRNRYKGPKPPFRAVHIYVFTVYIVDCRCDLPPRSRKADLLRAIDESADRHACTKGRGERLCIL